MIDKIKYFYMNNKYNLFFGLLWIICTVALLSTNKLLFRSIEYWIVGICVIFIRYVGYKEGRRAMVTQFIENGVDVHVPINTELTEPILCELKYLQNGMCFSFINNIDCKYIKCNDSNTENMITCWNLSTKKFSVIHNTEKCVVHSTKTIYVPIVKLKRG